MQLIPAIDIREGRCVRLLHGDFGKVTHYDYDPRDLAVKYRAQGAEWLHVVDLDGAKAGRPMNGELIREIAGKTSLRIQIGGGIRSEDDLAAVLGHADRAVIGSLAVTAPDLVAGWLHTYGPDRITLGLDVRLDGNGVPQVTTHGWTRSSGLSLEAAIATYRSAGLRHVLCTDVDKDGALAGPNFALYEYCVAAWPDLEFQASGGVSSAADLSRLAAIGVAGAISGKALLDNLIQPEELKPFLPNA